MADQQASIEQQTLDLERARFDFTKEVQAEDLEFRKIERDRVDRNEKEQRSFSSRLGRGLAIAIPIFVALILPCFTVLQQSTNELNAVKLDSQTQLLKARLEFQRDLHSRRIDTYKSLVQVTGKIFNTVLTDKWGQIGEKQASDRQRRLSNRDYQNLRYQLNTLEFAELPLVQDPDVQDATALYGEVISYIDSGDPAELREHIKTDWPIRFRSKPGLALYHKAPLDDVLLLKAVTQNLAWAMQESLQADLSDSFQSKDEGKTH